MAKRSHNARDEQGKWDIGGGALIFGQRVEQALRDEIKQEYCADVLSFEFLGFRDVHRTLADGTPTHWIGLDYKVLVDPKQVTIGELHKFDDLQWFTLDNLPADCHSQFPEFLSRHSDRLR